MGESETDDSNLVSYCGLFCPDCPLFKGKISDLAKDLRKELRQVQYDKFAKYMSEFPTGKELKQFKIFYSVLGSMVKYRCENSCKLGGGSKDCEIRKCNLKHKFNGCWECSKYELCKKLDALNSLHGNKHRQNLKNM
ncbi:MAG: DUF3795 domain-containing protein [Candidatus Bathyarchaeota archaeon]